MKTKKFKVKAIISILLALTLITSSVCLFTVFAADTDLADTNETTYYLWGQNNNGPNFGSMNSPTGKFSYDSSIGYYYDLSSSSFSQGDYCFVISTVSNSGSNAVNSQAIKTAGQSGSYYITYGTYSGNACFHIWNDKKDSVRISFKSATSSVECNKAGVTPTSPSTSPSTRPTSPVTTPTSSTTTPGSSILVYLQNDASWSGATAYCWNSDSDKNAGWPGEQMQSIGGNIYQYKLSKNFKNIIFSDNGNNQTTDLTFPGSGYIYNNKTGQWSEYDTSPLQILSADTDLQSPQYVGTDINLTASAKGVGSVMYKFSVKNSSGTTTVLKDFSTSQSAKWNPSAIGTYTLIYDFKDTANNKNQRTKTYVVESDSSVTEPIIKSVTPSGQILVNQKCNISVTAGGGKVGTNLLFYKYTIADSNNTTVNVPYYTRNNSYSFTPTSLGTYTLTVSCQASDNTTVARSYKLQSVKEKTDEDELQITSFSSVGTLKVGNSAVFTVTATGGEAPYTYQFKYDDKVIQNYSSKNSVEIKFDSKGSHKVSVSVVDSKSKSVSQDMNIEVTESGSPETRTLRGDSDRNTYVDIMDATIIQKWLVHLVNDSKLNLANADADNNGYVDIMDATCIQKHLVNLLPDWPMEG